MLTSAMIGEWDGSSAKNASALASRWKSPGRIFAVSSARTDLYPTFQFDEDGKPRLAIAEVLRQFSGESEWANASGGTDVSTSPSSSPGRVVPIFYTADQPFAALSDTVFHDVPNRTLARVIFESRLAPLSIVAMKPLRDLRLVHLHWFGLRRLSIRATNLKNTEAAEYLRTIAWARALHAALRGPPTRPRRPRGEE